ncbi:trypsin-like peptidase domain-containing protein [Magnetospirillum sulfuroxidans]|uniref:SEL1-like repeat protein n=1 Tax=Magnetospirillum sulfuroxidans TaxID=611300 RepID=A0ABS5I8L4_9PROT|nr:trypsin-like peptidase domain-containing protein [Magnetospirillum sulfuroxidans]MBR9970497.1 SEL1-like repeat protein [Magnetospirillum sulfuroxidans]
MMKRPAMLVFALGLIAADAWAGIDEGLSAYQRKDWPVALREFEPLAKTGDTVAQSRLGHMLLNGNGLAKDLFQAVKLLTEAAEKGDALAQNTLGGLYFRGNGVGRDPARALIWFGRAAEQNQPNALNNLGQLYFTGNGVAKNEAKALEYLRRAADMGISASWESIGIAYWHGRGVPVDKAAALPWLKKAAERGHLVAQNLYGAALWTGDAVTQDRAEAVRWFERSGAQGDAASLLNLAHVKFAEKDLETAYYYYILAERQAKAKEKAKFTAAKEKARQQVNPDQERRASEKAANWSPRQSSPGDVGDAATAEEKAPPRPQRTAGSGLMVNRDGTVLTNSHVVKSCRNIRVSLGDGTQAQPASLLARDDVNDLAVLNTTFRPADTAHFRDGAPMRSGDNVVAVGFPLSALLSREPNITAGVISAMNGLRGDKRHYQVTAPIQRGNSGGPLADMNGNVVGIVVSTLNAMKVADASGAIPQNVNFAIKAELARKFMTDNGVNFDSAPAGPILSVADVGDIIRKVAVFVECEG